MELTNGERFDERTSAFEKIGRAAPASDDDLRRSMARIGAEVVRQAVRLVAMARAAGLVPAVVRVAACWDRAPMKYPRSFESGTGVDTRVEVYDAGGVAFGTAAYVVVSVSLPEELHSVPGTPGRADAARGWAARFAAAVEEAWSSGAPGEPAALHVYAGCAWDLALRRWQGRPDDRIAFADLNELEWFCAASAPR